MTPLLRLTILALACVCVCAQYDYEEDRAPRYVASSQTKVAPTPVPILKQINRHNEDGSYTYGYEGADGSFKIETKSAEGEVKGKYGYKDDTGKVRVIEYGANKYGFQPAGEGITVAPPTLVDETTREEGQRPGKSQGSRNQYRAQPSQQAVDYDYDETSPTPAPRPRPAPRPVQPYQPAPQSHTAPVPPKPQFFAGAAPAPQVESSNLDRQSFFSPAPAPLQQHQYRARPAAAAQAPLQQHQYRPRPAVAVPAPLQQHQYPRPAAAAPVPASQYNHGFAQQAFAPIPVAQARYSQAPQQFNQQQFDQHLNQPRQAPFTMLDQLLKEYSLPQGSSAPTHDVTFGAY